MQFLPLVSSIISDTLIDNLLGRKGIWSAAGLNKKGEYKDGEEFHYKVL